MILSAPATISDAEAEPPLTSTTSGAPSSVIARLRVHLELRVGGAAVRR